MGGIDGAGASGDRDESGTCRSSLADAPTETAGVDPIEQTLVAVRGEVVELGGWKGDDHGRYRLTTEIARGGGGRVVGARDLRLERDVAIKLPLEAPGSAERLVREARLMAQLEHPAIVSVHDLTRASDGTPCYVMKRLDGETLRDRISGRPFEQRIALLPTLIAIVDAVAYAHHRRIIHRDLKPANVIVGRFGEVSVIDWGLAREAGRPGSDARTGAVPPPHAGADVTEVGSVVGTPAYMAPEQARGELVDVRADVYGLGALLYRVLGGEAPYGDHDSMSVLAQVRAGPPRPLTECEPRVPAELAAIVAKAMARDAPERYRDARELAADLRRYQDGRLVAAHRYSRRHRARLWARRHRAQLAGGALVIAAAAALVVAWPSRGEHAGAMCERAAGRVAEVWSPATREEVEARLRAVGAASLARYAGDRLGAYARALGAARVEVCAATHVRGEQSNEMLDRRMGCLDGRVDALRATIAVLDDVAAAESEPATRAIDRLPALAECDDREALLEVVPLPPEPDRRAAAISLRGLLAAARAAFEAGRFEPALARASEIVVGLGDEPYLPFAADAHVLIGEALYALDRVDDAERELHAGFRLAEMARDDRRRAAALRLVTMAATRQRRPEAERRVRELEALAMRLDDDTLQAARLALEAELLEERGEQARAVELGRRSLELIERSGTGLERHDAHRTLGTLLIRTGHYPAAEDHLRTALALIEQALGPDHPAIARALIALAIPVMVTGRPLEALPMYERARALLELAGLGASEEMLVLRHNAVGVLIELRRLDDAEVEIEAMLGEIVARMGPDAKQLGSAWQNLGWIRMLARDPAGAEPWFQQAVDHYLRIYSDQHPRTVSARYHLAHCWIELGRPAAALPLLEAALPIQLAQSGPGSDDVAYTQHALARAYVALGQPARAVAPALAALPFYDAYHEPRERGLHRLTLARALLATRGAPARVSELADLARRDFVEAGADDERVAAERLVAAPR